MMARRCVRQPGRSGLLRSYFNSSEKSFDRERAKALTYHITFSRLRRLKDRWKTSQDNLEPKCQESGDQGTSYGRPIPRAITSRSIFEPGPAITYDRFGRVTQDGDLTYVYDDNGNRLSIGYPDSVSAIYTYDAADRQSALTVEVPGVPDASVVTASSYEPAGPLASVTLGNGLTENRAFDTRYFPGAIQVNGGSPVLDWDYTTDDVGNIADIGDVLDPVNDRTYGYQDYQYYLTRGDGPWGDLSWTYDLIGNRLSETRDAVTDTYTYIANAASGNSARLDEIQLGAGGTTIFAYDAAGNQTQVDSAGDVVDRTYDDAGRMSRQERASAGASTDFLYDGRSYLRDAAGVVPDPSAGVFCDGFETGDTSGWDTGGVPCPPEDTLLTTEPTYSSEGLLHRVASSDETSYVFYFGGRPVAQLAETAGSLLYLSTDHLGTPILASDEVGGVVWEGGFEPFGADYSGASAGGVFLGFPGQWRDDAWSQSTSGSSITYNVFRWYQPRYGRYSRVDPLRMQLETSPAEIGLYVYVASSPINYVDLLGLERIFGLLRGRVANYSSCCVLVSGNNSGGVQQQFWVPPRSSVLSTDIDAIYFGSGAALKIPDGDLLVILTCQETSFSGEFMRERNGSLGGFPPNRLRLDRLKRRVLPTMSDQEQEFGAAILPPQNSCCDENSSED